MRQLQAKFGLSATTFERGDHEGPDSEGFGISLPDHW